MELRGHWLSGALLIGGCEDAASVAVIGIIALVTGWAISAGLRSRDGTGDAKSNEVDGASSLLPRFQTPAWLEESQVLLRVFGAKEADAATNETKLEGLPFSVGFVVDIDDLVVRFNDLRLDGVGHTKDELYELALDNLRACQPKLELPVKGLKLLRDKKGHAAARALLIPRLLDDGGAVYVAAPSRELLLVISEGDEAMRNAHAAFEKAESEDAPIPVPVRVTAKGFEAARWG